MQNKGCYAVQSHSTSSRSVSIESQYATSYKWWILTDVLFHIVSELSQLIVQILCTLCFEFSLGGLGTTYDVHLGLVGKRIVDFLLVLIELFSLHVMAVALPAKIDRKIGILIASGSVCAKFLRRRGRPPPITFAWIRRPMNALQLCRWQFSHKEAF